MRRFLLLLAPEPLCGVSASAADLGARADRFTDWLAALAARGALRSGGRLDPRSARVTLEEHAFHVVGASSAGVGVRHYFEVELPSWDAAIDLAQTCPCARPGSVEVFEVEAEARCAAMR